MYPPQRRKRLRDQAPQPRRDFFLQAQKPRFEMISSLYKEPVYRILENIKNKSYFLWPNKMSGDVIRRNQSLYCSYHRDRGHITEDCQTLKDHFNQLKKAGYLKEFMVWEDSCPQDLKGAGTLRTSALAQGLIGVIHMARKRVEIIKTSP